MHNLGDGHSHPPPTLNETLLFVLPGFSAYRNTVFLAEAKFHFMALSGTEITSGVLNFEGL